MAKKEQCNLCKGYNPQSDLCTIKWEQPSFDGVDCDKFQSQDKAKPKPEDYYEKKIPDNETQHGGHFSMRVLKRGKSFTNRGANVKDESYQSKGDESVAKNHDKKESNFVIEISENVFYLGMRILGILLFIVVVLGAIYGAYAYMKYQERKEKDDLIWKAKCELETIRGDKTIGYLRLDKVICDDNVISLSFLRNTHGTNGIMHFTDSIMYKEIASLITIAPVKWDSICSLLQTAGVDLNIIFSDVLDKPSIVIPNSLLRSKLLTKDLLEEGNKIFIQRKSEEIIQYARKHFSNDICFKVDTLIVSIDYVTLQLTYDDSKARLGKSFLDTTYVSPHFTDPVGDMGSILDGMLMICERTNKGLAFSYIGEKSKSKSICLWNAEKTKAIAKEQRQQLYLNGRKTNQVYTVITREKGQ